MTRPATATAPSGMGRAVVVAVLVVCTLLVPVALLGCGPATPAATDRRTVTVAGQPWTVLVAGDAGMRGRDDFAGADGMLFDMGRATEPSAVAFVMDGVRVPLAIAWFAADGRLVGTDSMVPCDAEPCARYLAPASFRWAIEAPVGAFDRLPSGAELVVVP